MEIFSASICDRNCENSLTVTDAAITGLDTPVSSHIDPCFVSNVPPQERAG